MNTIELLKNPKVIEEIHRHLWIESEKVRYNRGLDWAAEDWLNHYAKAWIDAHIFPKETPPADNLKEPKQNPIKRKSTPKTKRRPAKSYIHF